MAEICTSPFDVTFWDWDTKKVIEVQIYNASLALYNAQIATMVQGNPTQLQDQPLDGAVDTHC